MFIETRFSVIKNTVGKIRKNETSRLSTTPDIFVKVNLPLNVIGKLIQQLSPVCITILNQGW